MIFKDFRSLICMGHGVPYKEYINFLRLESHFTSEDFYSIHQENKHTQNISHPVCIAWQGLPRGRGNLITPGVFRDAKGPLHRTQEFQGHQEGWGRLHD